MNIDQDVYTIYEEKSKESEKSNESDKDSTS